MIVVKIMGGLGNQISQYAFAYWCAKKFNTNLRLDISSFNNYKLHDYSLNLLNINAEIASKEDIKLAKANNIVVEKNIQYDEAIFGQLSELVYLDGYWGDHRYYDSVRSELIENLRLIENLSNESKGFLNKIKNSTGNSVSIHFRRGDYVTNNNYLQMPVSYYENAINTIKNINSSAHFFIFSDDIDWVKANIKFENKVTYIDNENRKNVEDLWLMSQCQHNIVANSTFSYWGAWLNNSIDKKVIYPEQYFKADAPYLKSLYGYVIQPYYPISWHKVPFKKKQEINVAVWNYQEELNDNNFIFLNKNTSIGNGLLKPINDLYHFGKSEKVIFNTLPMVSDWEAIDLFLFMDFPNKNNKWVKKALKSDKPKFLIICETEVIKPDNWDINNHQIFDKIFTWNDDWVDFKKYIKLNFCQDISCTPSTKIDKNNKLCTLINSSKLVNHPNGLYSKRIELIHWFENNHPEDFDLYGRGWTKQQFPSYLGEVEQKLSILLQYKFSICFENAHGYPGYITEKIFDCFKAGCVPIYWGASNVEYHIPDNCFIDFRKFSSFDELYQFLIEMEDDVYQDYLLATQQFIDNHSPTIDFQQYSYPFSTHNYVWTLVHNIKNFIIKKRNIAPKVSILVPTYNQSKFIGNTIDSILKQNIGNVEIIIIDNASTDDTQIKLNKYRDIPGVRIYINPINYGSYTNHLRTFEAFYGEYYAVLHSDDYYGSNHLINMITMLDKSKTSVLAYCPCYWIDENNKILKIADHNGHLDNDYNGGRNELADLLIHDCYITPSAALIRKSALDDIYYVENGGIKCKVSYLYGARDWSHWVIFAYKFKNFSFLKEPSVYYRVHSQQASTEFYQALHPLIDHVSILEMVLGWKNIYEYISGYEDAIYKHLERRMSLYSKDSLTDIYPRAERIKNILDNSKQGKLVNQSSLSNTPLVSIIVCTYNRPELLEKCLESISKQSYSIFEVILVNDAGESVDEVIRQYDNAFNIVFVKYSVNRGQVAARNLALKIASGEVICFLDDDDVFLPHHLQVIVEGIKDNNFVYTLAEYVIENNKHEVIKREARYKGIEYSQTRLFVDNFIPINTWGIRANYLKETGFFDETMNCLEDWELLIRLSKGCNFVHIPQTTVEVHLQESGRDSVSSKNFQNYHDFYKAIYLKHGDLDSQAVREAQEYKLAGFQQSNSQSISLTQKVINPYEIWKHKHAITEADGQVLAEQMQSWTVSPNFLILTVLESEDTALLADTIDSLNQQYYGQWSLAILSASACPDPIFDELEMVHWIQAEGELYTAINQVLLTVDAFDWVAVIRPGTVFEAKALSVCSNYINLKPEWSFIYVDEDHISATGETIEPLFKPDCNPDLLRSLDYVGEFCLVKKLVVDEFKGYCGLAGVLNWDIALRIMDQLGDSSIGHIAELLVHKAKITTSDAERAYLLVAGKQILEKHLERNNIKAQVQQGLCPMSYYIDYPVVNEPWVSIIIAVLNEAHLTQLKHCISAILENTEYKKYRIVVSSSLSENEIETVFGDIKKGNIDLSYCPYLGSEISPLSNRSASDEKAEFLLFYNLDLIAVQKNWLSQLIAQGLRKNVGVVSARIVDMKQKIHHAGVVLGMGGLGVAGYPHRSLAIDHPGYMNRAQAVQNLSAVSSLCFLLKTDLFKQVITQLPTAGSIFDHVEICLRIRKRALSIVWTPYVTLLINQQSLVEYSLDKMRADADKMLENWLPQIAHDPAYNRHLSLKHNHLQVETETDVNWNIDFHDRLCVYAFPANETGIGEYRVRSPLRALTHAAKIRSSLLPNHNETLIPDIVEIERTQPDVLLLQNGTADYLIHAWQQYKKFNHVFRIYAQDDLISALPQKHPLRKTWPKDIGKRLRKMFENSDRLIVATEPLQQEFGKRIDDVRLIPNYLERSRWTDLSFSKRERNNKLRVGWAGGGQHHGDLELIFPVIEATKDEVDWIFMGMCPEYMRPHIKEYHGGVVFDLYPEKLASLDLDLAIAPLEYNNFNMAKTNLRLLEYGILGWPVLCTDIFPYQNAPVTRVPNNTAHWIRILREKINEPEALKKEGELLQQWVLKNYILEDHLDEWLDALTP